MSAFDTAVACARGMLECMNQNLFETPPYGPVPDATAKLRVALNNQLDAFIVAMDAESRGVAMPAPPTMPEAEAEAFSANLMPEHALHRDRAEAVRVAREAPVEVPELLEPPPHAQPANTVLP